ncbi:ATP-binding protein [Kribbella sancticallisti]|uniref:ATP-binding protein n=1 Tax=Kribbella sancticallisti TaxID=460087 RepID=A0ABN2DLI1_9ACTN
MPAGDGPVLAPRGERVALLVDGYERLGPVDGWVRDRLLPRLPATSVTVMAGRLPPRPEWRADAAWSELLRVVSLRNLDPDATRSYLDRRGVPVPRQSEILTITHGHPLTLSLVVDVLAHDPDVALAELPTDLVGGLLERLVSGVPSAEHRRALEVSAVARTTTEGLLRDVLSDSGDPHALIRWLAGLSVAEVRSDGVLPHDLVRDLLDADLRWRDPDGYREVFRAIRAHALGRVRRGEGREQQRAIADLKFLFRNLRSVLSPVAWEFWGDHYPDRVALADRDVIIELIGSAEGDRSAALAKHWLDRQPAGFHVIREPDGTVRGVVGLLDLTNASRNDRAVDPGTAAAWSYVERTAPVRAGEVVTQCRFIVDAETYQGPSPTLNAVPILTLQRQLTTPRLAWDFVTLAEPDRWEEYFAAADLPRAVGTDFFVDGRRYGLFAHDFRRVPVEAMTERWTERALADDALLLPAVAPEPGLLVLSHTDVDTAVRQAMKDLHRPDLLARNPLLRTRLVTSHQGATGAKGLEELIRAATAALAGDPRDDKLFRALDRTYLRTSRTQEAAAATLGLPFSTYRRHLRQGVDRVVASLWQRELGRE